MIFFPLMCEMVKRRTLSYMHIELSMRYYFALCYSIIFPIFINIPHVYTTFETG